jgi:hypothetical protein
MTLFCKDCKHYHYKPYRPEEQYTGGDKCVTEHRCDVVISIVTGEPEIRDAEAMRNGVYKTHNCGYEGNLFEKHTLENLMPNPLVKP